MTYAARQVLADCHLALQLLEEEQDLQRWRVHWAAAVALTRAVGHVLDKIDGENPIIKEIAKSAFARWKVDDTDEIFRAFIDTERNNVLKEYKFNLHPSKEVEIAIISETMNIETREIRQNIEIVPITENIYRPMVGGFREGDDARDVLSEALEWWGRQLDAIDAAVADRQSSNV